MEDHTKITAEDTKVRSRVGMLIRAVFMGVKWSPLRMSCERRDGILVLTMGHARAS